MQVIYEFQIGMNTGPDTISLYQYFQIHNLKHISEQFLNRFESKYSEFVFRVDSLPAIKYKSQVDQLKSFIMNFGTKLENFYGSIVQTRVNLASLFLEVEKVVNQKRDIDNKFLKMFKKFKFNKELLLIHHFYNQSMLFTTCNTSE